MVIEVQPGYSVARLGLRGLFFEAKRATLSVHFDHTIALGVVDGISKDGSA